MPLIGTPCQRCLKVGRTGAAQQLRDLDHSYCKKCRNEYARGRYQSAHKVREQQHSLLYTARLLSIKLTELQLALSDSNPLLLVAQDHAKTLVAGLEAQVDADLMRKLEDEEETNESAQPRRTKPKNPLQNIDNALNAMRAANNAEQIRVLEDLLWEEYPEIAHERNIPNRNNVPTPTNDQSSEENSP